MKQLVDRIRKREELKLKSIKLQMMAFHNETSKLNSKDKQIEKVISEWKKEEWHEGLTADKEDIKAFGTDMELFRKRK
jgi:hypothetical protein